MADIAEKLEEARKRAENYGYLYGRKETADDYLKLKYAELYEDAQGDSVGARDSWVKRQPEYINAVERKRDAYAAWKAAETYLKLLFAECDMWRTEQANNRRIDKAHE